MLTLGYGPGRLPLVYCHLKKTSLELGLLFKLDIVLELARHRCSEARHRCSDDTVTITIKFEINFWARVTCSLVLNNRWSLLEVGWNRKLPYDRQPLKDKFVKYYTFVDEEMYLLSVVVLQVLARNGLIVFRICYCRLIFMYRFQVKAWR